MIVSLRAPQVAGVRRGILLLPVLLGCFVMFSYLIFGLFARRMNNSVGRGRRGDVSSAKLPSRDFDRVSKNWGHLDHLIVVPGHGVQWCTNIGRPVKDPSCWYLFDYQKPQVPCFLEHIQTGADMARNDSRALLIFSGGQTRSGAGPRSEAWSYFSAAESLGILDGSSGALYDRVVTEEFARDSLENLLFSMARFQQITGSPPRKITIVGFPFKARRFLELHRVAARISEENFTYISVFLPGHSQDAMVDDAYDDFKTDLYGCGPKLLSKKIARNPYKQQHGYKETSAELRSILSMCDTKE